MRQADSSAGDALEREPYRVARGPLERRMGPPEGHAVEPAAALDPGSQSLITEFLASWSGGSKTVVRVAGHAPEVLVSE